MKFGRVPLAAAEGTVLAHALYAGDRLFKKGRSLSTDDLARLAAAGHGEVTVVRLETGDLGEDAAATTVARGLVGPHVRLTPAGLGRANLVAAAAGLFTIERAAVDLLNGIDERITLATLPSGSRVEVGTLVATVKVIPFALPASVVERVAAVCPAARAEVHPWRGLRAGLVLTRFPRTGEGGLDKAAAIQRDRLARIGGSLAAERRVAHEERAVAAALEELLALGLSPLLVLGASATADRDDVIPSAIRAAGGTLERLGLPVDPGNLLMLARIGTVPVVGVPACARAPRRSGFDPVLERLAAGLPVTGEELATWGVGGLLAETPRPAPRRARERPVPEVGAVVLAAGGSTRMGGSQKLTALLDGVPLVTRAVDAALAARVRRPVVVVTGHRGAEVRAALAGREVTFVANPAWETGLASSLRAGLAALPAEVEGALVCLGDMPRVQPSTLDALATAFDPASGVTLVAPSHDGRRGNPVLFGRCHFAEMAALAGDTGARALLEHHTAPLRTVEVDDPGVGLDVDTPEMLARLEAAP
jgi:molybdenum cofactor cytidylyltransferase